MLGFQNGSQIDDFGVPGGSKRPPGGVRGGSWHQVALGSGSGSGLANFGPLLGGVLGPMLGPWRPTWGPEGAPDRAQEAPKRVPRGVLGASWRK